MWNTDISKAPRGFFIKNIPVLSKGKPKMAKDGSPVTRTQKIVERIWAAMPDGSTGFSYWVEGENRWSGMEVGQEPVAFIALPTHYEVTDA